MAAGLEAGTRWRSAELAARAPCGFYVLHNKSGLLVLDNKGKSKQRVFLYSLHVRAEKNSAGKINVVTYGGLSSNINRTFE